MIKINKLTKSFSVVAKPIKARLSKSRWARIFLAAAAVILLLLLAKSLFVAALVNGRPISRISLIKELEKQGGQNVLDQLIEKSLVSQEAKNQGVKISRETVEGEIKRIEELLKEQNLTLDEALSMRSETRDGLYEQIELQKKVEALLAQKVNISDDEVQNYFDENKDFYGEGAEFEELKDSIRDQLYQQELNNQYAAWIEGLRSQAKIIYLLKL